MHVKWAELGDVFLVGLGTTVVVVVLFSLGVSALGARAAALDSHMDQPAGAHSYGGVGGATAVAGACFLVCALVVIYGVYLIIS
ncbi:hypothetical protein [Pseudonocardia spinosispora]|uniref:hypothetical protein n=1 Tax=Pseudonocardia spinosispora TaxID=103441 RepID=UPI000422BFE2|nr:hypothetical protein [Pseudonocardia spinosispora]